MQLPQAASPSSPVKTTVDAEQRPRPEDSFRIKDSLKKIAQAEPALKLQQVEEKQEQVVSREAFNQQQVVNALENYVAKYAPEPIISIALKSHKPDMKGESVIILADNQLQLDKLVGIKIQIQNFLMRALNNGFISVAFHMFDNGVHHEEKKLFTSGEKFEHFIKLNPAIADLKVIFGLELE